MKPKTNQCYSCKYFKSDFDEFNEKNPMETTKNNWIEIKKKLWSLAIAIKGSTKEEFPADLCNLEDYIHSLLSSQLREVVGVIESVRPVDNGTVRYHESYNDGKRDLADEVKAEVEKLV